MKTMWNHFIMVATITSISIVVFAMLAPDVDQSAQEVGASRAYSDVRTLRDEFVGEAPHEPTELEDLDPWGNTYIIQAIDDDELRVASAGPDGVFDSTVPRSDDIWTDMPTSPLEPFQTQRNRELLRAIAVGFLVWSTFMTAYWWSERSLAKRQQSPATDSDAK